MMGKRVKKLTIINLQGENKSSLEETNMRKRGSQLLINLRKNETLGGKNEKPKENNGRN